MKISVMCKKDIKEKIETSLPSLVVGECEEIKENHLSIIIAFDDDEDVDDKLSKLRKVMDNPLFGAVMRLI